MNQETLINENALNAVIQKQIDQNSSQTKDTIVYINNEVDRIHERLYYLETDALKNYVEIYGIPINYVNRDDKRMHVVNKIANKFQLSMKDVLHTSCVKNHILLHVANVKVATHWQTRSRDLRLTNRDIGIDKDGHIKAYIAAPEDLKLLLRKARETLTNYKYIWIGKDGVMLRENNDSRIYKIKNQHDLSYFV